MPRISTQKFWQVELILDEKFNNIEFLVPFPKYTFETQHRLKNDYEHWLICGRRLQSFDQWTNRAPLMHPANPLM